MPGLLLPLVAWGAPEDISAWASFSTPVITPGQADPFGGTGAVLVEDNDAVSVEGKLVSLGAYASTSMLIAVMAKAATALASLHLIRDTTAGISRGGVTFTWSGGVPVVTGTLGTTVLGTVSLGGGWYLALGLVNGLVAGNVHERRCYGSGSTSGADVGSTYWYFRNLALFDYPDEDKPFDGPPPGSARVRAPSGIVDRWIPGGRRDYRFKGTLRWIPSAPRAVPQIVSGWDGLNEAVGINCGVRAMLEAGQEGNELIWVPDRSNCAVNIPSDLVAPFDKDPYDWENVAGDRKVAIELVNTTTVYPSVL